MKVLLITDDQKIVEVVEGQLEHKEATLDVRRTLRGLESYLDRARPQIVINAMLSAEPRPLTEIKLPRNYQEMHDYWALDFDSLGMERMTHDHIRLFLQSLPIPDADDVTPSPFSIQRGRIGLRQKAKPPRKVIRKAKDARRALLDAKEAVAGLASFEEDVLNIGNKVAVPLSRDALEAIDRALDASLALTDSPVLTRQTVSPLSRMAKFFQDAEKAIKQVEKTATAGVKAAGVLGILAGALGAVVWKLKDLLAVLGVGG